MNRDKLLMVLGAALFLSLSVNFFMAGTMLGRSYNHGGGEAAREKGEEQPEWKKRDEELRQKLSEPDRTILKAAMQQKRPQFQALRQALDDARQKVTDAQNAEPFDKAALDAALKDENDKKTALLQTLRQARDEIGSQMSPEGRATFSKLGPGARMGNGEGRRRGGPDMDRDGPPRMDRDGGRGPDRGGMNQNGPPGGGRGFGGGQGFSGSLGNDPPPQNGALPPPDGQNSPPPQP